MSRRKRPSRPNQDSYKYRFWGMHRLSTRPRGKECMYGRRRYSQVMEEMTTALADEHRAQRFWTIRSISSWNSPRIKYPFSSVYPIRQQQQQNQKGRHTIEMGIQIGIDGHEPDDESLILSSASFLMALTASGFGVGTTPLSRPWTATLKKCRSWPIPLPDQLTPER
jgi:hypothetical protein